LLLASLLCLAYIASAEHISKTVGPYNVSFDLNGSGREINITGPIHSEYLDGEIYTYWDILINKDIVDIYIQKSEKTTWDKLDWEKQIRDNHNDYETPGHATRIIDGSRGGVAKIWQIGGNPHYVAMYSPAVDPHSYVSIISYYPWDSGTLQLLKTIHIEKANS